MTTQTNYKPSPRSWGDGYIDGYRQAVKDALEILDTADNHSYPINLFDCARAIRALVPRGEE